MRIILKILAFCLCACAAYGQLVEHHGNTLMSGTINGSVTNALTNFASVGTSTGTQTIYYGNGANLTGISGSGGGIATNGGVGSNNIFYATTISNGIVISPSNTLATAVTLTNSDTTNGVQILWYGATNGLLVRMFTGASQVEQWDYGIKDTTNKTWGIYDVQSGKSAVLISNTSDSVVFAGTIYPNGNVVVTGGQTNYSPVTITNASGVTTINMNAASSYGIDEFNYSIGGTNFWNMFVGPASILWNNLTGGEILGIGPSEINLFAPVLADLGLTLYGNMVAHGSISATNLSIAGYGPVVATFSNTFNPGDTALQLQNDGSGIDALQFSLYGTNYWQIRGTNTYFNIVDTNGTAVISLTNISDSIGLHGNVNVDSNLTIKGTTAWGNGYSTLNATGTITQNSGGAGNSFNGGLWTDGGSGNITAVSFTGAGSGLTNIGASSLTTSVAYSVLANPGTAPGSPVFSQSPILGGLSVAGPAYVNSLTVSNQGVFITNGTMTVTNPGGYTIIGPSNYAHFHGTNGADVLIDNNANVTISGVLTGNGAGLTNIPMSGPVQYTNFASTSFATYYTNTFGRRINVYLSYYLTQTASAGAQIAIWRVDTNNISFNIPTIFCSASVGVTLDTAATNTATFLLAPGAYFSVTNTVGTAALVTNTVEGL